MEGIAALDRELYQPKTLIDACLRTLAQNHDALGDLGWHILPNQLRSILHPCSRSQLETIEDSTLEGSGRDLTWYTWHLWFKVFVQRYGAVRQDTQLIPLPGQQPMDYEPPPGIKSPPADYRAMIMQCEESEATRKAAAVQKLRGSYQIEARKRAASGTDFTTKLPPPKRGRFSAAAQQQKLQTAAMAHKTLGGKPAVKVLNDLGLKKTSSFGRSSSNGNNSSSSRVVHTSSRVMHTSSSRPGYLAVKPAAPKQQQQSALACLARDKVKSIPSPAAAAAGARAAGAGALTGSRSLGEVNRSASAGDSNSRTQTTPARTNLQQERQQQQQRNLSSPSGKPRDVSSVKRNSSIGLGLLDTPMKLTAADRLPLTANRSPSAAAGKSGRSGPTAGGSVGQKRQLGQI